MNTTQATRTVRINGTVFTVEGRYSNGKAFYVTGKRGGTHTMVRNWDSGRWYLLRNGTKREAVTEIEWLS